MRALRCLIGLHKWIGPKPLHANFGDKRQCKLCGRKEVLVIDRSGWNSGFWEKVD